MTGRLLAVTDGAAAVCETLADGDGLTDSDFDGVGDMDLDLDGDADFDGVRLGDGLFELSWSPSCPYANWLAYCPC